MLGLDEEGCEVGRELVGLAEGDELLGNEVGLFVLGLEDEG